MKTCKSRRRLSIDPMTSRSTDRMILSAFACLSDGHRKLHAITDRPSEYESVLRVWPRRDTFFIMDELHRRVLLENTAKVWPDFFFFEKLNLPNATSNQIWYRALQFIIVCCDHSYMFHCRESFDRNVDTFLNTLHVVNSLQQKGNEHELYLNIW